MNRREFFALGPVGVAAAASMQSCTPPKNRSTRKTTPLGERVEVGPLVFIALETQWSTQLGSMPTVRTPKNQFLAVRISITNQGGGSASCPLLSLVDDNDQRFPEVDDAKELDGWLGLVRMIEAGGTEFGWILFDAPPSHYALRLTDGNVENEHIAFIDLPLRLENP